MPTDTSTTTKGEVAERERNFESRRETESKHAALSRRTPYLGPSASPFSLMRRMADDIERLFSDVDFARTGFGTTPQRFDPISRLADAVWAPQVETFRRDGNLVIRADLPGLKKDDITIDIDDEVLTISGERNDEKREERDDFYRTERVYGRFFRAIQLPEGVNADQIDATFKDGVLEVAVPAPKVNTPRNKQVKIR